MRRVWRALAVAVGTSFRADPLRSFGLFALLVPLSLSGVLTAYSLKVIVDGASAADEGRALAGALVLGVIAGLTMLANSTVTRMLFPLKERTGLLLDQRLIELVGGVSTIEHHEHPDHLARVEVLRQEGHVLATAGFTVAGGLMVVVEAAATGILLGSVNPLLLALPLFAIPSFWAGARAERLRQGALERTAGEVRQARHLFELATSPAPGKELRVYGLAGELQTRHRTAWRHVDRVLDGAARGGVLWTAAGWLLFMVGYAGAIAVVVREAVAGTATVGDVVLALTMVAQINEQVAGAVISVTDLARTVTVANRYLWLTDYAERRRAPVSDPVPLPDRLDQGIELRGLGFRYPDSDRDVLSDVDLFIPAGSTVALVGDNGAGKSTLVKLLCRLYEPSTGSILVDGVDFTRFDVGGWRARMSAAFQDFVRFELLARESIGVGDLPFIDDSAAVNAALVRAASTDVLTALPDGLDTELGNSFETGTELSGGQWQKLALARSMMRRAPLLLVLDEPTAALDVDTEFALFSRFASAAKAMGASVGAITLLVSHRFSTVQMADMIVVVDGGRVVEAGSHRQLVAANGLYAELFGLQARAYR